MAGVWKLCALVLLLWSACTTAFGAETNRISVTTSHGQPSNWETNPNNPINRYTFTGTDQAPQFYVLIGSLVDERQAPLEYKVQPVDSNGSLTAVAQLPQLTLTKRYQLQPGEDVMRFTLTIDNRSASPITGDVAVGWHQGQFKDTELMPEPWPQELLSAQGQDTQLEVTDEAPDFLESLPEQQVSSWFGLNDRYHVLAARSTDSAMRPVVLAEEGSITSFQLLQPVDIPPGASQQFKFDIFADSKTNTKAAKALGFGNLRFLSSIPGFQWFCNTIMHSLTWLQSQTGSWGWAIVLLAIVIRLLLYPLTQWGLKQQRQAKAKIDLLQPKIEEVKRTLTGAEQSEGVLQVYKDAGVSPLAPLKGLVSFLIQIPIFIALYTILSESIELRGEAFLWISNLAKPDALANWGVNIPYFGSTLNLLPVLMSLTTTLATNLDSSADNSKTGSLVLTLIFFVLFYNFAAGLVLYWFVSNLGHLVQQQIASWLVKTR